MVNVAVIHLEPAGLCDVGHCCVLFIYNKIVTDGQEVKTNSTINKVLLYEVYSKPIQIQASSLHRFIVYMYSGVIIPGLSERR